MSVQPQPVRASTARDADAWLRRAVTTVHEGELGVLVVPAPAADGLCLLARTETENEDEAAFYSPPSGPAVASCGEAAALDVPVGGTARDLIGPLRRLRSRVTVLRHPALADVSVPLLGGIAFDSERAGPLGAGRFVLGRVTYVREASTAYLAVAFDGGRQGSSFEVEAVLARALRSLRHGVRPRPLPDLSATRHEPLSRWECAVDEALARFDTGELEKVVIARSAHLSFEDDLDVQSIVAALRAQHPTCTTFAFSRPDVAFVGATPERLLRSRGGRLVTEALAGSRASGRAAGRELLGSDKDRREHELVVRDIVARLSVLCRGVTVGDTAVRPLRGLVHLATPIEAELRAEQTPLDAVAELHPTPAVGGVPRQAAMSLIRRRESESRGWYAGPVGSITVEGDIDLCVALRSGLVHRRSVRLYAGAGIVPGSDSSTEHRETSLKLSAFGSILAPPRDPMRESAR